MLNQAETDEVIDRLNYLRGQLNMSKHQENWQQELRNSLAYFVLDHADKIIASLEFAVDTQTVGVLIHRLTGDAIPEGYQRHATGELWWGDFGLTRYEAYTLDALKATIRNSNPRFKFVFQPAPEVVGLPVNLD